MRCRIAVHPREATMTPTNLRINGARLLDRLEALRKLGDTGDGGSRRMALTDADKAGRDLFMSWLTATGLEVHVDKIGNIVGVLRGASDEPAILMGSHIDTVATGGKFDGALGTLAALEVLATVKEAGTVPRRSLAVAAFTNEEGARFQPDILGSCVWAGDTSLAEAYALADTDGKTVGAELQRIGYVGTAEPGFLKAAAYLELHIEQGPVLDAEGGGIGAVTGVQAIWWSELVLTGEPNHAGTTPMAYRRNAALAAAKIVLFLDQLTRDVDGTVANTGRIVTEPGNVNVVPGKVTMTLDLRNPDDARLAEVERRLETFLADLARQSGIAIARRDLAKFPAQPFDAAMVDAVEQAAKAQGHKVRRMHSGAGHDAQMLATVTPTAMIFVPSVKGISHNPAEFTRDEDCIAGANVLLAAALDLASR
jgi:beta-ureidopropionase / N-carbamoyl-L-amino-acid hydrolase